MKEGPEIGRKLLRIKLIFQRRESRAALSGSCAHSDALQACGALAPAIRRPSVTAGVVRPVGWALLNPHPRPHPGFAPGTPGDGGGSHPRIPGGPISSCRTGMPVGPPAASPIPSPSPTRIGDSAPCRRSVPPADQPLPARREWASQTSIFCLMKKWAWEEGRRRAPNESMYRTTTRSSQCPQIFVRRL